jgi:hypothetical protein
MTIHDAGRASSLRQLTPSKQSISSAYTIVVCLTPGAFPCQKTPVFKSQLSVFKSTVLGAAHLDISLDLKDKGSIFLAFPPSPASSYLGLERMSYFFEMTKR